MTVAADSPVSAWIFDLGNTLMSIPDEFDEERCLAKELNLPTMDDVRTIIYRLCSAYAGQSVQDFLARFDCAVLQSNEMHRSSRLREIWDKSIEAAELKPHAHVVLDELRAAGVKLGLVSNTPPTSHLILDRLGLREKFDVIVFSCDVGFLKPDPRIFLRVLEDLAVPPQRAVVVGDKIRTDILGGALLRLRSILVEARMAGFIENKQNYVDAIVSDLENLRSTSIYREFVGDRRLR